MQEGVKRMKYKHSKKQKLSSKNMRNNPTLHEAILWKYLKNSQFEGLKFCRQQPIGKYIVDFCCFYPKIIIELDGGQHNDRENIEYDKLRDEFLKNEGYQVIRIWNNDITNNIQGVLEYLRINTHPEISRGNFTTSAPLRGEEAFVSELANSTNAGGGEKSITVQCPAKVNLTLKVTGKRPDGFHNIESIMQTINLYDYLTVDIKPSETFEIKLSGNSEEIPYNENNLVYKAAILYLESLGSNYKVNISIYIEKNIPVAAGLAGGSTDAAGTLFALNELFNRPFSDKKLHELCAKLGSDLNVCLKGGKLLCKGRGEIIEPLDYEEFDISLIKPKNLGISAKEAYTKFSEKNTHPEISTGNFTPPLKGGGNTQSAPLRGEEAALTRADASVRDAGGGENSRNNFVNDLEWAIIDDYTELQKIKELYPTSMMSGSGSTYFRLDGEFEPLDGYEIFNNLKSENKGIQIK